jgi:hypothetical protein
MSAQSPAIQLGLLNAIADTHGFPASTLNLSLDFAAQIGSETYMHLCRSQAVLADEWLFSPAALGEEAPDYFDYELEQTLPEASFDAMHAQALAWQEAWNGDRRPNLTFNYSPGVLEIEDRRKCEAPRAISTTEPLASLYATCSDQPHTAEWLQKSLGLEWSVDRVEAGLTKFCAEGLMMRDGNQFLSLALPASTGR